jgi:hypothetical protein
MSANNKYNVVTNRLSLNLIADCWAFTLDREDRGS